MSDPCVRDLITYGNDDRGTLTELCRVDWPEVETPIKQVYTVQNYQSGTVRAFHCHEELWDYFLIVSGAAKFILFKYDEFLNNGKKIIDSEFYRPYIMTHRKMQMLTVPPGWMHGWQSLQEGTILVSIASKTFDPKEPDCKRIAWDSLGEEIWKVKYQ